MVLKNIAFASFCLFSTKWMDVVKCDSVGTTLSGGEELSEGDRLTSDNGNYRLYMQDDGNCVAYEYDSSTGDLSSYWSTGTNGAGSGPYKLKMQNDDNLVVYDDDGDALWSSNTAGDNYSGVYLILEDDGSIVLYSDGGDTLWQATDGTKADSDDDDETNSDYELVDSIDYSEISVIGVSFEYVYEEDETLYIDVPDDAEDGDLLVMIIGSSDSSPDDPSGSNWVEIIDKPEPDVNIKAFYKEYDGTDSYSVSDGKNNFVTIIVLRGVDNDDPIVDADGDLNSYEDSDGSLNAYGVAKTRSIETVDNGIVIAGYMFDDPHRSYITNDGYVMLVMEQENDDGCAIGCAETDGSDTGEIWTIGTEGKKSGNGNEVAMSFSMRPASGSSGRSSTGDEDSDSGSSSSASNSDSSGDSDSNNNGMDTGLIILFVCLGVLFLIGVIVISRRLYLKKQMENQKEALSKFDGNNDTYKAPQNVNSA